MTMPKLTGRQIMRGIKSVNPSAKIILVSGFTAEGTPEELIAEGASDFIQKPYTLSVLSRSLRAVLDGR
jgi:two-component system, cell cycle sensor histidine kinase and response regulator CckA